MKETIVPILNKRTGYLLTPMYAGSFFPESGDSVESDTPRWTGEWPHNAAWVEVRSFEEKSTVVDGEEFKKRSTEIVKSIFPQGSKVIRRGTDEWDQMVTGILKANMNNDYPDTDVVLINGLARPFFTRDEVQGD